MKWTTPLLSAVFALVFISTPATADEPLTMELIQRISATSTELGPIENRMGEFSDLEAFADYDDPADIMLLSNTKQDQLFEAGLKEQGLYDKAEAILDNQSWDSYGDYIRNKMRIGLLVIHKLKGTELPAAGSEKTAMLLKQMPPSKADIDFVDKNWEKIIPELQAMNRS
jgi:hypothetical protein